ncbi:MAG TPA: peptidoglycan-binding domain-containing protein [Hymenobacter sp.]|jgi:peptidoglycan hydrolase-like protein with peptidoglycan-binding domain
MSTTLKADPTPAAGVLANVYTRLGRTLRVPLRGASAAGGADCVRHPEQQFMRWFNRQVAANPAFAAQVKSILLVVSREQCVSCQQALVRFLSRFNLGNRLRLLATDPAPGCGCTQCQKQGETGQEHEEEAMSAEMSRWRMPTRSAAFLRAPGRGAQPGGAQVSRLVRPLRRRSGLVRTLVRPGLLGYQLDASTAPTAPAPSQSAACAAPGEARPTLRFGARGEYVKYMQCRLNFHKVSLSQPLVEDGVWGPKTQAAVRSFQQGRGLAVDTVVGPQTWAQLDASSAVTTPIIPTPTTGGTPTPTPGGTTDLEKVRFRNATEINAFFRARTGQDFVDWFRSKVGGRGAWVRIWQGKTLAVTMPGTADVKAGFQQFWDGIPLVFNSDTVNFAQFAALQSVLINETGGTMRPIAEAVGIAGHPGLAYAFNKIPGLKASYNGGNNKTALALFNDPAFLQAHGQKPLGQRLANTQDGRWGGVAYPAKDYPTSTDSAITGFVQEADFYKFRGRGYIQITWRNAYQWLIPSVQNYNGSDPIIQRYRAQWQGLSLDAVATRSSNADWNALFMQSPEFALGALKIFFGHKSDSINRVQVGNWPSVRQVACDVMCTPSYKDLFEQRVKQIFNTLGTAPVPTGPPPGPVPGGGVPQPTPATGTTEAAQREAIVANALAMMAEPTIEGKSKGADGFRKGWQKLKVIFETAAPDYIRAGWEENNLKRSTAVSNTAGIPHWCGIFALWAHRAAGLNVGTWKIGKGIGANPAFRSIPAAQVKKGDVGYINQPYQHHFIVREVYPDGTIDTIDGNSAATSTISTKSRVPKKSISLFFSAF